MKNIKIITSVVILIAASTASSFAGQRDGNYLQENALRKAPVVEQSGVATKIMKSTNLRGDARRSDSPKHAGHYLDKSPKGNFMASVWSGPSAR